MLLTASPTSFELVQPPIKTQVVEAIIYHHNMNRECMPRFQAAAIMVTTIDHDHAVPNLTIIFYLTRHPLPKLSLATIHQSIRIMNTTWPTWEQLWPEKLAKQKPQPSLESRQSIALLMYKGAFSPTAGNATWLEEAILPAQQTWHHSWGLGTWMTAFHNKAHFAPLELRIKNGNTL